MKNSIEHLQQEIREKQAQIIKIRLEAPLEEINNYRFKNSEGKEVDLLSLFEDSDELLVIHNMGKSCRFCTMWADGFRGYSDMISDRMPWVLTSPDEHQVMREFVEPRKWNFNYLSYFGTSFGFDLGFAEEKKGRTWYSPGVSALIRKDGKIYRTSKDFFGPGDLYNPAWHFFDLFPKGADGWQPKYEYKKK